MATLTGVILAAGRGLRISPLSDDIPKPMLPVLGKPIMEYQIEAVAGVGIREVLIVTGFLEEKIREHFGDGGKFGLNIDYTLDPNPKGIASSLHKVKKKMRDPFLCFLGDIFVEPKGLFNSLNRIVKNNEKNVLLIKEELDKEIIRLHAEVITAGRRVARLIEKPKNPQSNLRTCGIYLFTPAIFEAIEATPVSALRGEVELTDAIDKMISLGQRVYFEKLKTWDVNVTYPRDLKNCAKWMKRGTGKKF